LFSRHGALRSASDSKLCQKCANAIPGTG